MIGLNKIGLNQVQLNQLYLNTLCACQKSSGGDGFPHLRGDVTRWSFKGLTNEQMSKNPRLEDADHKGRFLTFKNFAWGEMSGCGGYDYNFSKKSIFNYSGANVNAKISSDTFYIEKVDNARVNISIRLAQFKCRLKITGVSDSINSGEIQLLRMYSSKDFDNRITIKTDGIYDVDIPNQEDGLIYIFAVSSQDTIENPLTLTTPITIEQLPLYPGFIIGDGVDDYAVTEKNLDFEDTYTVYTAFIPFQEDPARNMVLCGKNNTKDFYMNYSTLNSINFYSSSKAATVLLSNGFNLIICKRTTDKMIIKNLLTNVSVKIDANAVSENPGLYYLWRSLNNASSYAKAAIAGQVICNGHFTTDEEDTKVLNWYKKEYPWLFFDQAWTVTGKTNEDTDRATIANITGNGNNLVLSNFGFAGNSGYGEYPTTKSKYEFPYEIIALRFTPTDNIKNIRIKFVLTGLSEANGEQFAMTIRNSQDKQIDKEIYTKDGTYVFTYEYTGEDQISVWGSSVVKNSETNYTVDIIPDHDGYLVTDGVDDKVHSSAFTLGKKFTVVGEWELLDKGTVPAGFIKPVDFYLYPHTNGLSFHCKRGSNATLFNNIKSLVAFNSEGVAYDHSWQKYVDTKVGDANPNHSSMTIGTGNNTFAKVAFKNMAMYAEKVLSKEDMIKAYIYLQTLKAK